MRQLNVPNTLRRVAASCPDSVIAHRLLQAADAIQEPSGVQEGVHLETDDPMTVLTDAEPALLPIFEGLSLKDDTVRAATDLTLSLAAWIRQLELLSEAISPEGDMESAPELDGLRTSLETLRGTAEGLMPWADKWKQIATTELEHANPKFPELPKTTLPSPHGDEGETKEEEPEAEPEDEESSPLDELANLA